MIDKKFKFFQDKSSGLNDNSRIEKENSEKVEFNSLLTNKNRFARSNSPMSLSGIHLSKNDLRQAMYEANALLRMANDELAHIARSSIDK